MKIHYFLLTPKIIRKKPKMRPEIKTKNFFFLFFKIQMTTLCVSISLSAYVTLFCLFSPKIYIIIFHPDKNIRKLTMNSNTYKKPPSGISYFPSNPGKFF